MQFVFVLQLVSMLLMPQTVSTLTTGCEVANWLHSMDVQGWSVCRYDRFIKAFNRSEQQPDYDPILLLEEAECCPATIPRYNSAPYTVTCLTANWQYTLDGDNVWALCPSGYYLSGLYISMGVMLMDIERARCCRPQQHPDRYGDCYDEDVSTSFDSKGWSECARAGYLMTGFYKGNCDFLHCIEKFRCCSMI
ncbi:uncharacterized protein LOC110058552 [Orbicella faveolata]|uniref:uncharacterized protein LOC110058552 n=1 Tax=Orbicella faveolata TaxID=48498 RepID=UPI0009E20A88|nr:uncharacterized protein LOC110058552 [Orbicella faveolata]XP_020620862.1 uncharacterized protein LOC110058552 [Orbicella faveolata]